MDCPNCKTPYNHDDRVPHLLTVCGHSLCKLCLSSLFKDSGIDCPECGINNKAESTNSFPKNQALLVLRNDQSNNSSFSLPDQESITGLGHIICVKHRKNIEGNAIHDIDL